MFAGAGSNQRTTRRGASTAFMTQDLYSLLKHNAEICREMESLDLRLLETSCQDLQSIHGGVSVAFHCKSSHTHAVNKSCVDVGCKCASQIQVEKNEIPTEALEAEDFENCRCKSSAYIHGQ